MISVSVVEDSIGPGASRLVTMKLIYPRFIHSELMTHRVFSRNAASSRAIPLAKFRSDVMENPAVPSRVGKNGKGMQDGGPLTGWRKRAAVEVWLAARYPAVFAHWLLGKIGAHKQVANRLLEPWFHMTTLVTATLQGWESFVNLRDHPDADPTIASLAKGVRTALCVGQPRLLKVGEWHLPFVTGVERTHCSLDDQRVHSVARCARVSYSVFGSSRTSSLVEDTALFSKLAHSVPAHESPFEHQATPLDDPRRDDRCAGNFGDLSGWMQFRQLRRID
jgi:hypothetical protein